MRYGKFEDKRHSGTTNPSAECSETMNANMSRLKEILLYFHDLVLLMGIGLLVLLLCFKIVIVSGSSMKNTLIDGDYLLLLSNVFYREPQYGDIIVASKDAYENGTPIVKRVIATSGQEVDIDFTSGVVYVDGIALDEPYVSSGMLYEGVDFPLVVSEGCLFVMGDNRIVSQDSRSREIGLIDSREVLGKAILLFLPGTDRGNTNRDFSRLEVFWNGK